MHDPAIEHIAALWRVNGIMSERLESLGHPFVPPSPQGPLVHAALALWGEEAVALAASYLSRMWHAKHISNEQWKALAPYGALVFTLEQPVVSVALFVAAKVCGTYAPDDLSLLIKEMAPPPPPGNDSDVSDEFTTTILDLEGQFLAKMGFSLMLGTRDLPLARAPRMASVVGGAVRRYRWWSSFVRCPCCPRHPSCRTLSLPVPGPRPRPPGPEAGG